MADLQYLGEFDLEKAFSTYFYFANNDDIYGLSLIHIYLNLERPEGLTYTQMAADMRKTILGETNIKYISSLNNTGRAVSYTHLINKENGEQIVLFATGCSPFTFLITY